jgi:hypothetical protein
LEQQINNCHFSLSLDSISKIQKREIQINLEDKTIEIDLINNVLRSKKITGDLLTYQLKECDKNISFKSMHKLIVECNTIDIVTYNDGLQLSVIINNIRSNSK